MAIKRISVVVSQGQSQNPTKRKLEEDIITALMLEPGVDVTVVPNLYDLKPDSTGMMALQGIQGPLIVLSWLYSRAAHWLLDRNDVRGRLGTILLEYGKDDEEEEDETGDDAARVADDRPLPKRPVYCLDLRASETADDFVNEVKRISREANTQVVDLLGSLDASPIANDNGNGTASTNSTAQPSLENGKQRFETPTNNTALKADGSGTLESMATPNTVNRIDESAGRRWYPVIDFSRCTNCMECIDFCLFGVYGVDGQETILVEQPDNCRKGCPACSRVCPENAIIFPQHKTPAIAGAEVAVSGLKIDLSKLFGAPDTKESAIDVAARERDEQLLLAGREAVGKPASAPKRQTDRDEASNDELDDLLDQLDDFDV